MHHTFRCALAAAIILTVSSAAGAQDLKLSMANGRVSLVAQDVPLRQILAEWARIGQTRIINGDKLAGPPVTLELVDIPEKQALEILLRSVAGYMVAQRAEAVPGASVYDRVMILPTSRPPVVSASFSQPPAFNRPMPQPMPVPVDDDETQAPGEQGVAAAPGILPPGAMQPGPQQMPGVVPPGGAGQTPPVLTAPRPGMLPAAPPTGVPGNPYSPPNGRPPVPPTRPGGGQ
ncbi:MAG: hypothetical protein LC753_06935 [Acidobacteria bacterium]|nr:hypothetical protein [Acidobacteriota bacterium]MCA1650019.1 hypothetical protein [Acidobacteriota bacterium]